MRVRINGIRTHLPSMSDVELQEALVAIEARLDRVKADLDLVSGEIARRQGANQLTLA